MASIFQSGQSIQRLHEHRRRYGDDQHRLDHLLHSRCDGRRFDRGGREVARELQSGSCKGIFRSFWGGFQAPLPDHALP